MLYSILSLVLLLEKMNIITVIDKTWQIDQHDLYKGI